MKNNLFTFNNGRLLCWRLGPINAQKQKHYNRDVSSVAGAGTHKPPASRGIWAFPYPHYDYFFCWHQWEKHLPKRLMLDSHPEYWTKWTEEESEAYWQEKEAKLKEIKKRFRPSTFYSGKFYSHIFPNGNTDYNSWWYWDRPRDWAKVAQKTLVQFDVDPINHLLRKWQYTKDHLEIFVVDI